MILLWAFLQWVSMSDRKEPTVVLSGVWTSCPREDGDGYTEKIYTYRIKDSVLWSLHLGEREEFALFAGESDEHIEHDSPLNLLGPAFHYGDVQTQSGRHWSALGVHLSVIRMPGSFEDCYSFQVLAERDPLPTWARR